MNFFLEKTKFQQTYELSNVTVHAHGHTLIFSKPTKFEIVPMCSHIIKGNLRLGIIQIKHVPHNFRGHFSSALASLLPTASSVMQFFQLLLLRVTA